MSGDNDNTSTIVIICVGLWLFGLYMGNIILQKAGSLHPMINATTFNPRYSSELHDTVAFFMVVWSIVCGVLGFIWHKASTK